MQREWLGVMLGVLVAVAGGCARPAGVLFSPAETPMVWPPPPDVARVRYVGEIRGAADLKAARGGGEGLVDAIFGREPSPGMVCPMGVATDGGDRVFVTDSTAQVLHVLDLETRRYERWTPPASVPAFLSPVAVAFDAARARVLVCDSGVAGVYVFDARGGFVGLHGTGQLKRPCGVAVQPGTGHVFVADAASHQVVVLSPEGAKIAAVGRRGTGAGEFNFPTYLAFDSMGRLLVADSLNFRVQVFSPDLEPVAHLGSKGDMPGYFSQPKGLATGPGDMLFVADANFEAVQVFDAGGALLMTFGREGRGPGEFWLPAGVAADASGRVWIADSRNRRVQVFEVIRAGELP